MKELNQSKKCPSCGSSERKIISYYETVHNGSRRMYQCQECKHNYSETQGTPMAHIKTALSKVASVFRVRSEGMGLRATARIFGIHKNTVCEWENKFANQKEPLMLYALCHEFISLTFEGDELYTIIGKRCKPSDSEGWTTVVVERASRFIIEQHCGKKDERMFKDAMETIVAYIKQSEEVTFLSDGERRYGNVLFDICAEVLRTGSRGRPPKTLPPGVKVSLKNKGSQNSKPGRKRPKYEAPHREHPDTNQILDEQDIHANHVEAQNAVLRRKNSAFRRRTNTYAKSEEGLQRTLDVHQIIHNFVRTHWTTGVVPAVAMGIITGVLGLKDILTQRFA
jgi:transposase-like protein